MKFVTKLVAASVLALSAVAPALAAEESTLLERNTFTAPQAQASVPAHRAVDAMAYAPTGQWANGRDFGIGSQS